MDLSAIIRDYLASRKQKQAAKELFRDPDRKPDELTKAVANEALRAGMAWPTVLEDPQLGVTTVPQTYEGLLAFLCSWDALLLDEEMIGLRAVVDRMTPMRQEWQEPTRKRRAAEKQKWEHLKVEHPEAFDRMQGWRV